MAKKAKVGKNYLKLKNGGGEEMKRLKLIDLCQLRNKERKEKGQGDKRFRINPGGDIYLILIHYSEERISARNTRTGKVEEFNGNLFVILEGK